MNDSEFDDFAPRRVRHFPDDFEVIPDKGCEFSTHCLQCPLPRCKEDDRGLAGRWKRQKRNLAWLREQETGRTVKAIAEKHGVTSRQIFRGLREARRFLEDEQVSVVALLAGGKA